MMIKKMLLVGTTFALLTGCGASQQQGEDQNNNITISEVNQKVNNPSKNNLNGKQIAKRLVNIATRVPDVRDATAIVAGNYAVVGIDIDKNLDRTQAGNIKNAVTEALTKDPYGANAIVTSDPDIIQRLKNMGKSIKNGKALPGIANELALIVERLVPEVPNKTVPDNSNNEKENPKMIKEPQKQAK